MTALDLLADLRARGVRFSADGDRVRVHDPGRTVSDNERGLVRALKPQLRALLIQQLPNRRGEHACNGFDAAMGLRSVSGARSASPIISGVVAGTARSSPALQARRRAGVAVSRGSSILARGLSHDRLLSRCVSTTSIARLSRLKSSTIVKARMRRPDLSVSCTKSSDQRVLIDST